MTTYDLVDDASAIRCALTANPTVVCCHRGKLLATLAQTFTLLMEILLNPMPTVWIANLSFQFLNRSMW